MVVRRHRDSFFSTNKITNGPNEQKQSVLGLTSRKLTHIQSESHLFICTEAALSTQSTGINKQDVQQEFSSKRQCNAALLAASQDIPLGKKTWKQTNFVSDAHSRRIQLGHGVIIPQLISCIYSPIRLSVVLYVGETLALMSFRLEPDHLWFTQPVWTGQSWYDLANRSSVSLPFLRLTDWYGSTYCCCNVIGWLCTSVCRLPTGPKHLQECHLQEGNITHDHCSYIAFSC